MIKVPQSASAQKPSTIDPRLEELFGDIDKKIENLPKEAISNLIEAVQLSIKNNHKRLLGLSYSTTSKSVDFHELKHIIEKENHFLARSVLPKLYNQIQPSGAN